MSKPVSAGPDPIDVAVGARIKARREALGLGQVSLAASLGVKYQQLQQYERGANRISASMLVRTAARLGIRAAALLGEADAPPDPAGAEALLAAFREIDTEHDRREVIAVAQRLAGGESGRSAARSASR